MQEQRSESDRLRAALASGWLALRFMIPLVFVRIFFLSAGITTRARVRVRMRRSVVKKKNYGAPARRYVKGRERRKKPAFGTEHAFLLSLVFKCLKHNYQIVCAFLNALSST